MGGISIGEELSMGSQPSKAAISVREMISVAYRSGAIPEEFQVPPCGC